jgi:hypothetical protein
MSGLAIILCVVFACLIGLMAGYICGRSDDHDPRRGHPYDYDRD